MSITVRRFNPSYEMAWDEFVESSNNGTLFHTRKFLNYHPEDRFLDHSLILCVNSLKVNYYLTVQKASFHYRKTILKHR